MSNNKDFKVKNGIQPTVYHEGLGTVTSGSEAWSLGAASYDGVSFSVAAQESAPRGISFKPDGTKMYVLGTTGDDVNEYDLSTAWDISTASYNQNFSVAGQETGPTGLFFKPDGTKMYICGASGDDVNEYDLSTAWDISTASFLQLFSVSAQDSIPASLFFKPDGTKMYVLGDAGNDINEYDLSTAWDISTASYLQNFSVASQETLLGGLFFKDDGTAVYVVGYNNGNVNEYNLSTAWDISTASFSQSFYVGGQQAVAFGLFFKPDGTQMFISGQTPASIFSYSTVLTTNALDLSTGSVFEVTPTSDIQVTLSNPADSGTVSGATLLLDGGVASAYDIAGASYDSVSFSVASQDSQPRGLAFNSDGTKMYIAGDAFNKIFQYSLSTAFDISTASYNSVSSGLHSAAVKPMKVLFNTNGTKMFILCGTNDRVYEYNLSTAFDVSTSSYNNVSENVQNQDTIPMGFAFNNDGTKMYMVGNDTGRNVFQYSLSTAFDLSTASYDSVSFSVSSQEAVPRDIVFNSDGTKMYMVGNSNDTVHQYSFSTSFDLSTASYDSISFSVASQDSDPHALAFSNDGTKMYMIGVGSDTVHQYSTATPATITYPSTVEWPSGTAPTSPAIGETDIITFNTRDGGSTYQGVLAIDGAK